VIAWGVATALPLLDGAVFEALRHRGFGPAASLGLFGVGVARLGRAGVAAETPVLLPFPSSAAERRAA
jgi:hypothetical protein